MRGLQIIISIGILIASSVSLAASHKPQAFLAEVSGKPNEGQRIVSHFCSVCHAEKPQIPMGAPREGIENDWQERAKKGFVRLCENTANGFGSMPARGGCFECSDKQLELAILALLPEKIKKQLLKANS